MPRVSGGPPFPGRRREPRLIGRRTPPSRCRRRGRIATPAPDEGRRPTTARTAMWRDGWARCRGGCRARAGAAPPRACRSRTARRALRAPLSGRCRHSRARCPARLRPRGRGRRARRRARRDSRPPQPPPRIRSPAGAAAGNWARAGRGAAAPAEKGRSAGYPFALPAKGGGARRRAPRGGSVRATLSA